MLSKRLTPTRIPLLRPLRPPASRHQPRLFTQNTQLLLIARNSPRPQLPFLSQPTFGLSPNNTPYAPSQQQPIRLLSNDTKQYIREQAWLATKWTVLIWVFMTLGSIATVGWNMEVAERNNPTPDEWRLLTRQALRAARRCLDPATVDAVGFVSWARVYACMHKALKRLEDPEKEGKGLTPAAGEGEEILIPDVGKAGFDVSGKSWPWRAGYFEVVMGCAKAAEYLDNMVVDTTRRLAFPKAVVLGPSNPDPRPVPPHMDAAPREENCEPACPPPETFYMRILTGKGFTTTQKLDAALAYAQWLEFKGLPESAEEMYTWGIDIAKSALTTVPNPDNVVDSHNVIKTSDSNADAASENLLRATTSMAIHHARTGNVSAALPIFLSVLRARGSAPISLFPDAASSAAQGTDASITGLLKKVFSPPKFPPPPPSGDDPLTRQSAEPTCDDSELMLYIGEILFATSPSQQEGLRWTRQAVDIANRKCERRALDYKGPTSDEQKRCRECLVTGAENWEVMLRRTMEQEMTKPARGWFSLGGSKAGSAALTQKQLESELVDVVRLRARIVDEGMEYQVARARTSNPSGVWLG